jgi:hypothetical protein
MNENTPGQEHADEPVKRRLERLGSVPVDTSGLDAFIRREIAPRPVAATVEPRPSHTGGWERARGYRAYAASFAALLLVSAIVFMTWTTPAIADSSAMMLRVHEDLVSGRVRAVQVDSIDAANRAIKEQWPASPGVPLVPAEHVMKCCMRDIGDKRLACVLIEVDGTPVSMAVAASSAEMHHPRGRMIDKDGQHYTVEDVSGLNMVMTRRDGKWVCLMGKVDQEKLLDLATKLAF